jgi:glycosyltransferase involved in cell wall biosynthesis
MTDKPTFSLVITVFKSEANLPPLLSALNDFAKHHTSDFDLECVFVVDGSPDQSLDLLCRELPKHTAFRSQLHDLTRNFGAPQALRCGLQNGTGDYYCTIACDLQEPFDAVFAAFAEVQNRDFDICFGKRVSREDPWHTKLASNIYWFLYRRFVQSAIPEGGVDFFVCKRQVRDALLRLREQNSFLAGLLFWLGYRRSVIPYQRQKRQIGRSSWSFRKKLYYLLDSVFCFSDLPIKLLLSLGFLGLVTSIAFALSLLVAKIRGTIPIPGYAATVTIVCFFGGLNSLGLGIIGEYVWHVFENTKARPHSITRASFLFNYPHREDDAVAGAEQASLPGH